MNGRRAIGAAQDSTDADHNDIAEEMFTIALDPRIGERFETRPDRPHIGPRVRHAGP